MAVVVDPFRLVERLLILHPWSLMISPLIMLWAQRRPIGVRTAKMD